MTGAAAASLAGAYRTEQMEIAGALELQPGGHFRYALEYGGVSESGEGDWMADDTAVRLTSSPMPTPPAFELVRDDPAPTGELFIALEPPGFGWDESVQALATVDGSVEKMVVATARDGRVDLPADVKVTAIEPLVPMDGSLGAAIPLSADRGHRLLLRFCANDLGRAAFHQEPLARSGNDLLLTRYDTVIRFLRVQS
jgi:hypothetical protein